MEDNTKIIIATIIMAGIVLTALILTSVRTLPSSGRIVSLNCEADASEIQWGNMLPNSTALAEVNVRVTGNTPATLSFNITNWQPVEAQNYLTLSWNYTGNELQPMIWMPIEFSLYANPDAANITTFSFDINIVATGGE